MKVHLQNLDENCNSPEYATRHGSFGSIHLNMNRVLKELGHYAEPDEADVVGHAGSLKLDFKYKNKPSFLIHVWETLNALPLNLFHWAQQSNQRIFGLSNQTTQLWTKMGYPARTVYGGCDTKFWQPSMEKNPNQFQFLSVTNSNVRSGIDQMLLAFAEAFRGDKDVRLVIKDSNQQAPDSPLMQRIEELRKAGCDIVYFNDFLDIFEMRDLYSQSHVTLNVLRMTSFGLPLLECSACESLCVTGDVPATNEIIDPSWGALLKPARVLPMRSRFHHLESYWGLKNWYPNFTYVEEPQFAEYDIDDYANLLRDIRRRYKSHWSQLPMRQTVQNKWTWERSVNSLLTHLSNPV